ncbi:MAG: DUF2934 domain-containing protein [Planctomycetia bacterium]|nr:DUF2934 domain-containing protein [Planctomycetia bacterium]
MAGKASAAAPRGTSVPTSARPATVSAGSPTRSTGAPIEEMIRLRAYLLWEQAGQPDSDGVEFWLRAERELTRSN